MPSIRTPTQGPPAPSSSLLARVLRLPRRVVVVPAAVALAFVLVIYSSRPSPPSTGSSSWDDDLDELRGATLWQEDVLYRDRARCELVWNDKLAELTHHSQPTPEHTPIEGSPRPLNPIGHAVVQNDPPRPTGVELAREMMGRTKGFYVRDYPL